MIVNSFSRSMSAFNCSISIMLDRSLIWSNQVLRFSPALQSIWCLRMVDDSRAPSWIGWRLSRPAAPSPWLTIAGLVSQASLRVSWKAWVPPGSFYLGLSRNRVHSGSPVAKSLRFSIEIAQSGLLVASKRHEKTCNANALLCAVRILCIRRRLRQANANAVPESAADSAGAK